MNSDKILRKAYDLAYRIELNKIGLEKASYNLKYANTLGLTQKQINEFDSSKKYYEKKLKEDQATYKVIASYADSSIPTFSSDYLFKCTLPFNKVDSMSGYQTSILVNDSVVGLFANGVNYKEVISCLEPSDIVGIQSTFSSIEPVNDIKDVSVEVLDDNKNIYSKFSTPVVVSNNKTNDIGLVSQDTIPACYSDYKKFTFKDLDGNSFNPCVPSLDDIISLQRSAKSKEIEYNNYKDIENKVIEKINIASDKMNYALNECK